MLKKILFIVFFLYTAAFSASNEQIIAYFKAQIPIPGMSVTVISRAQVQKIEQMDFVSLELSDGDRVQKVSVFTRGDLIFPDVISLNAGGSIKDQLELQGVIEKIAAIYKKEDPKNIITIGTDPQKETLVEFSDPECPFCTKELANIEEKLDKYNLKIIFTPVHDRSALEKSLIIYEQSKSLTDAGEIIKIMRKYFTTEPVAGQSDERVAQMETLRQKYFNAGLKGVPFYVAEEKLLK